MSWCQNTERVKTGDCCPSFDTSESIGGPDAFVRIIQEFYRRFMADPVTSVLFNPTDPDSNVSAEEHGKRLALGKLQAGQRIRSRYRIGTLPSRNNLRDLRYRCLHRWIIF